MGKKCKLQQEVPTRWNATLIMIRSLLGTLAIIHLLTSYNALYNLSELKEAVTETLKVMDRHDLLLSDWEWETLAGAALLLKPFDILTQDLSSQHYPSLSKVLPSIILLQDHLKEIDASEFNDILIMMCSALHLNLKDRFNEFYTNPNAAHTVATYVDPR